MMFGCRLVSDDFRQVTEELAQPCQFIGGKWRLFYRDDVCVEVGDVDRASHDGRDRIVPCRESIGSRYE